MGGGAGVGRTHSMLIIHVYCNWQLISKNPRRRYSPLQGRLNDYVVGQCPWHMELDDRQQGRCAATGEQMNKAGPALPHPECKLEQEEWSPWHAKAALISALVSSLATYQ